MSNDLTNHSLSPAWLGLIVALSAFLGVILGGAGLTAFSHTMPFISGMTRVDFWIIFAVIVLPVYSKFGVFSCLDLSYVLHHHWGDLVGLWLIIIGVAITLVTPYLFKSDSVVIVGVTRTGDGLIGAGLMALKLKTTAFENQENKLPPPPTDGR